MAGLTDVVRDLAGRAGVQAVVVLSADGLAIEQASRDSVDVDSLAALTATVVQYAGRLGLGANAGALRTAVLEYETEMSFGFPVAKEVVPEICQPPRTALTNRLSAFFRNGTSHM